MNALAPLLRSRTTIVWLILTAATVLSWSLGMSHHLCAPDSHSLATIAILAIAIVKIRFIGLYFRELRGAPPALRAVFEFYCAAVLIALCSMYLVF